MSIYIFILHEKTGINDRRRNIIDDLLARTTTIFRISIAIEKAIPVSCSLERYPRKK